jgi:hypothetical protein
LQKGVGFRIPLISSNTFEFAQEFLGVGAGTMTDAAEVYKLEFLCATTNCATTAFESRFFSNARVAQATLKK